MNIHSKTGVVEAVCLPEIYVRVRVENETHDFSWTSFWSDFPGQQPRVGWVVGVVYDGQYPIGFKLLNPHASSDVAYDRIRDLLAQAAALAVAHGMHLEPMQVLRVRDPRQERAGHGRHPVLSYHRSR